MLLSRPKPGVRRHAVVGVLGWLGAIMTLAAYALISLGLLSPATVLYQGLNLFASIALGTETIVHKDYQPFTVNVIWGAIALIALISIVRLHI